MNIYILLAYVYYTTIFLNDSMRNIDNSSIIQRGIP